jgi:nucleoid-associated protein YgaU
MKKTISSSFKLFVATFVAFAVGMGVTACVSSSGGDEAATEQTSEVSNAAEAEGNVALNNNNAFENEDAANEASGEESANGAGLNNAAANNGSLNNLNGNAGANAQGAEADPFASALNNSSQNLVNDGMAPQNPSAQAASGDTPAASGAELQNLVQESASGAATTPNVANAGEVEGSDPFAPPVSNSPVNNSANSVAETSSEEVPAVATDNASFGALPEPGVRMPYYIQKGDTVGDIAELIYGDRGQWKKLVSENNLQDPSRIYAGDVLFYTLNEKSQKFAASYEGVARAQVIVAAGDTLASLSEKVLGSSQEWRTLWKMNAHVTNPDILKVGTVVNYRKFSDVKKTAMNSNVERAAETVAVANTEPAAPVSESVDSSVSAEEEPGNEAEGSNQASVPETDGDQVAMGE